VAEAKLIIKPPHMVVRMKPGYWPDVPKMLQTVNDAGYKNVEDGVEVTVSGKVLKQRDQLSLELQGMKSPRMLRLVAQDDSEILRHLDHHVGESVTLEGRWKLPGQGKAEGELAVTAILTTKGGEH
jgi:hypothetical protein